MIASIMQKMIAYSEGSLHDINHFLKVHSYAGTIGKLEGLDADTQIVLEAAAIVHDIACPMLRNQYGTANGKLQEKEGMPLARNLLQNTGLTEEQIDRVVFLVGHHHSPEQIQGMDYQILIEADYLVNADESHYSRENIQSVYDAIYKTQTGRQLLKDIYLR